MSKEDDMLKKDKDFLNQIGKALKPSSSNPCSPSVHAITIPGVKEIPKGVILGDVITIDFKNMRIKSARPK